MALPTIDTEPEWHSPEFMRAFVEAQDRHRDRLVKELRRAERQRRDFKKAASALTLQVIRAIQELDHEMKLPSDHERGRRVAAICNRLEMANDLTRQTLGTLTKRNQQRNRTT